MPTRALCQTQYEQKEPEVNSGRWISCGDIVLELVGCLKLDGRKDKEESASHREDLKYFSKVSTFILPTASNSKTYPELHYPIYLLGGSP